MKPGLVVESEIGMQVLPCFLHCLVYTDGKIVSKITQPTLLTQRLVAFEQLAAML